MWRSRSKAVLTVLIVVLGNPSTAVSQPEVSSASTQLSDILKRKKSGTLLRVATARGDTLQGVLWSTSFGEIGLFDEALEHHVRFDEVVTVEERGTSMGASMIQGGVVGALLGATLFLLTAPLSDINIISSEKQKDIDYASSAISGAAVGAFIGAALGVAFSGPRDWRQLYP